MGGTGRRCALAGCGLPIDDVVGRPQRLYCTPAHRLAARQSRRAVAQRERQARLTGSPDRSGRVGSGGPRGDDAGWAVLAEAALAIRAAYAEQQWIATAPPPAAGDPAPDGSAEPALPEWARRADRVSDLDDGYWPGWSARLTSAPGRHRAPEPPGRRRSLAAIGAAGIVAGSYALTWLSTAANPGPAAPSVPVQAPPLPTSEQRWVARAQVTVTSIDEQLELLDRTERLWRQRRPTDPPPPALEIRRDVLHQRRTALTTRIDTVRALRQARAEGAGPEDRGRLDALEAEAAAAVRTPLPEDGERTAEIADEVLLDVGPAATRTGSPGAGPAAPEAPDADSGSGPDSGPDLGAREITPSVPPSSAAPAPDAGAAGAGSPAAGRRPTGGAERPAQRSEGGERSTPPGERPARPGGSEPSRSDSVRPPDSGATAHRSGATERRGSRRSDPGRTHSRRGEPQRTGHTTGSAERQRPSSPCDGRERPTHRAGRGHDDRPAERTSEGQKHPETKRSRRARSARDDQHDRADDHEHRHREQTGTRTG